MAEVKKIKLRQEIKAEDTWNVEAIYESNADWEKDLENLKAVAASIKDFSGKLSDSKKLLEYFKESEIISRKAEKLFIYAHLRSDEDTANAEYQAMRDKIDSYLPEIRSYEAFFVPEILSLPEAYIGEAIKQQPELEMYKFLLDDVLKMKPHTLSRAEEELLASVSDCLDAPENIFGRLSNADMTFPVIEDEGGNKVELTEVNYMAFIKSKKREVRENAFKALFGTYENYKNTFAATLTSSVKNFVFKSKTKKYQSSLESSLKPNNIPVEVYEKALETIDKNISVLHRYVSIKKKLLGLDEIHMYDLYVPIVEVESEHIEFEEAVNMAVKGIAPLGEEYLNIFQEGINSRWIDKYENKGKRGGAYSWGSYDTMPYVLLNYNYELSDVSTLVHEMGHSIHSYYSRKTQPYIYADYTLFCAEVASTTNEALLINYLIDNEKDKNKKKYLINQQLEQIRTTVFRQLMFAEFEKITHESIEAGNPLTAVNLCDIWHKLNKKYFGPEMIVDKEIDMEWARIPHFYSDFYVYQYATGYAAATSFAKSILSLGDAGVDKYKGFLKSGGSDYPINILKNAGVDMTTSKPLEDTLARFSELLDLLEEK
ncbi:oligoendopeptidase F [Clostridium sp. 19966]|uniref:oligoendopeptidase F n=1 Tax=Clostridium sp. 19966 TaxID=2768166 RepID=UPI0028DF13C1|nr:oligoendopeptidase F [Clostridium sp. 19966]MDT8719106.1 oligoendopeptidase F [Clostridium sp. 19966]